MRFIPILFSTEMVQAILDGRKTQTRRVVKSNGVIHTARKIVFEDENWQGESGRKIKCPYGQPGDVLWVRETFYAFGHWIEVDEVKKSFVDETIIHGLQYKYEDDQPKKIQKKRLVGVCAWYKRPSIHMPKEACRLFLKVISCSVERLQDISHEDAVAEGIEYIDIEEPFTMGYKLYGKHRIPDLLGRKAVTGTSIESYQTLWESINGRESWDSNPWVWVIEFEQIEKPENFC